MVDQLRKRAEKGDLEPWILTLWSSSNYNGNFLQYNVYDATCHFNVTKKKTKQLHVLNFSTPWISCVNVFILTKLQFYSICCRRWDGRNWAVHDSNMRSRKREPVFLLSHSFFEQLVHFVNFSKMPWMKELRPGESESACFGIKKESRWIKLISAHG